LGHGDPMTEPMTGEREVQIRTKRRLASARNDLLPTGWKSRYVEDVPSLLAALDAAREELAEGILALGVAPQAAQLRLGF
jgi:hypothetical protein